MALITNPLTLKKIELFKKHKRAYYSLFILGFISFISFFAEFIANDQPLIVWYKGELYLPIFKGYAETTFGGSLETYADYRNPLIQKEIQTHGFIVFPLIPFAQDTINYELSTPVPSPPTFVNWLGTDDQGRDVLARLIYGYRVSIAFSFCLALISSVVGICVGAFQGYLAGTFDLITQRFLEIWSGLPTLFLLMILSSLIEPSFVWLLGVMILFSWPQLVQLVRAEVLRTRTLDYVKAAQIMGVPTFRIILVHILPNATISALTYLPFLVSAGVSLLVSLDFLGFGLPPGSASLGELLVQGKNNIHFPWLGITAFIAMALLLSLLIFIGEGIRDAMDPRRKI